VTRDKARIGVFGPHLGGREAHVVSQGEVLVQMLVDAGYVVRQASARPRRVARALDTAAMLARIGPTLDVAIVAVYSGRGFAMAEMSCALAAACQLPVVLVLHGGNLPAFAARHPRRVGRLLRGARAVVAPSPFLARELRPFRHDIAVIRNALPLGSYPARTRSALRPRMLWMRTFDAEYRPELALQALVELQSLRPDATLTLAGQDNGGMAATRRLATTLGIDHAVTFAGFLGPDGKRRAFADHDLFLSTNLVDNAPVSMLEAARCGLVIVATANGGLSDLVIDGESALLVMDEFDSHATARSIASAANCVLGDASLARRLSQGAQQLGERSMPDQVVPEWEALIARTRHR
jgi:glycosyltransferase involved in cell wall biosynthesis